MIFGIIVFDSPIRALRTFPRWEGVLIPDQVRQYFANVLQQLQLFQTVKVRLSIIEVR